MDLPDQATQHEITAQASALANASSTPFGRLPDAVLLNIFNGINSFPEQRATYQSCKDMRDFCNRNMKSVTVQIYPSKTMRQVQLLSSKTVCPKAAVGIEKLTLYHLCYGPLKAYNRIEFDNAYSHLQQVFNDTFASPCTCEQRSQQLANISSIDIYLPYGPWYLPITGMAEKHCQILSRILSRFQNLQTLATDINGPLSSLVAPQLRQLLLRSPITPHELRHFASKHPDLQRLEFVVENEMQLDWFKPALLKLQSLSHLSIMARGVAELPADMLTHLTQLSNLGLHGVEVIDTHHLTRLHLTHLTLGFASVPVPEEQQQQTTHWPALVSVHFAAGSNPHYLFSETCARAILPLPHPGFSVTWPSIVDYYLNHPPEPQFCGFLGIAHMKSVDALHLCEGNTTLALETLVKNKAVIRKLQVSRGYHPLGFEDVASCLAFPDVIEMELETSIKDVPQIFRQIFLQCPRLQVLRVSQRYAPSEMKLKQCLRPLGVKSNWSRFWLEMIRSQMPIFPVDTWTIKDVVCCAVYCFLYQFQ